MAAISSTTRAIAMACAIAAAPVFGLPGDLDAGFGTAGVVTTQVGTWLDYATAVAVQPDGKVLVAGRTFNSTTNNYDYALLRYNDDGTLDGGFGSGGKVIDHVGHDRPIAVALQADGKIVVAAEVTAGFGMVRYLSDGTLDTTFGNSGFVNSPVNGGLVSPTAFAIQSDGKLLIAGYTLGGAQDDYVVARYDVDGNLDPGFGTGGIVITPVGAGGRAYAMALQDDGKIVVAGSGYFTGFDFAVVRYLDGGTLDSTFDLDGIASANVGAQEETAYAVTLQPDGKIVVAGETGALGAEDMALVRLTTAGALDTTFSSDGIVVATVGAGRDSGRAVAVQPDGNIVVGGYGVAAISDDFALWRFTSSGNPDTAFGTNGSVTRAMSAGFDYGRAVALDTAGRLVLVGDVSVGGNVQFGVARFVVSDTTWDVTPDPIAFQDVSNVALGSNQSSTVTISGLGAGVYVPVSAAGADLAINGGVFGAARRWVTNGDTLAVRHQAAASAATSNDSVVVVGGIVPSQNAFHTIGATTTDTFTSTTSHAPYIVPGAVGSIAEDAVANTSVMTAMAGDADGDALTYAILDGNVGSVFNIDNVGAITVQGALDYETRTSYLLTILVTDSRGLSGSGTVTINILDVNESTSNGGAGSSGTSGSTSGGGAASTDNSATADTTTSTTATGGGAKGGGAWSPLLLLLALTLLWRRRITND